MMGFLIAVCSGLLMSMQGVFNTQVTKETSMYVSAVWVQFSALLICLVGWFFCDRKSFSEILNIEPKYILLGGVIGAFITFTVIKSMEKLGPSTAVLFIVVTQLISAYIIDVFGLFGVDKEGFSWRKILGIGICVGGVILFKWK